VKRNRLGSKKAEELVYVHSNLRLLSHKRDKYKFWAAKLWDVEPTLPDLDMTLNIRSHMTFFDAESPIGGSSSGHGSNFPILERMWNFLVTGMKTYLMICKCNL